MRYFPLTDSDRKIIKKTIGIKDVKELFSDIPAKQAFFPLDRIPSALPETELINTFTAYAARNQFPDYLSFLGGGAYHHFIPEIVNYLSNKPEFQTSYTPYQPEVSQGNLQAIFEYQTMVTMLTGMDVANSSLYDGGTAAAEALLLALRKSRKNRVLIAGNLHPEYMEIIHTYIQNLGIEAKTIAFDLQTGRIDTRELKDNLDDTVGCFLFQSPNFFGVLEDRQHLAEMLTDHPAHSVQIVSEALSLPFLTPPSQHHIDIVAGEAQSFGIPLSYGGPFLGFIAARKDFLRQMPGRIVGQTVDSEGKRGYVLTLSTREQHIKREKATSNICTNQAWCALRASIYLSALGKHGLHQIARMNHLNCSYFVKQLASSPVKEHIQVKYKSHYFNEVVLELSSQPVEVFLEAMEKKRILPGIPLKWFYPELAGALLVNITEMHTKQDLDKLIQAIEDVL